MEYTLLHLVLTAVVCFFLGAYVAYRFILAKLTLKEILAEKMAKMSPEQLTKMGVHPDAQKVLKCE